MFFANPLFLIGLVAVAIPIAVHLFSFRRYRKVYFSNVDRIADLRDETRRSSRLRQLLLLAARILAIVFLVLAFAQPTRTLRQGQMRAGTTAVSIYIDNSFSMQNTDSDGPLLQRAVQRAREAVAAYRPSDRFHLLTNEMSGNQFRWLSRDELLAALDDVNVSPRTVMIADVVRRQHDFLLQTTAANRHAYVISDMQQSTTDIDNLAADSLIFTTFVPVEAVRVNNVYIDSIAFNAPAYHRGAVIMLTASVRNGGDVAVEKVPVSLYVDGRQRALASVDIPAGGVEQVPLRFVAETDGVADCYVETTDYPLTFDDRMYFSVNIAARIRVLAVGEENAYLKKLFDGDSAIDYHHVAERNIDFSAFGSHDLLVLNELSTFSSGLAQALSSYMEAGGTVLVVPTAAVDDSYNAFLAQIHAPLLQNVVEKANRELFVNLSASLYQGVFDGRNTDMERPSFYGGYLPSVSTSTVHETLIDNDGHDFLSSTPCGAGRLYLLASPLRQEYSNIMQQALFVPTFFNMALYSRPLQRCYYPLGYTDPIMVGNLLAADQGQLRLSVSQGDYEVIPDLRMLAGRASIMLHGEPSQPGNYRLHATASASAQEGLSFNYSRRESDMRFYSRSDIEQRLQDRGLAGYSVVRSSGKSIEQYVRQMSEGRPLWRWCVVLALLMLLAEIAIARWPKKFKN